MGVTGVDNVIEFRRVGDAIRRETVKCTECESRAMRIITDDAEDGWAVECYNCGELMVGLKVEWPVDGTPS